MAMYEVPVAPAFFDRSQPTSALCWEKYFGLLVFPHESAVGGISQFWLLVSLYQKERAVVSMHSLRHVVCEA